MFVDKTRSRHVPNPNASHGNTIGNARQHASTPAQNGQSALTPTPAPAPADPGPVAFAKLFELPWITDGRTRQESKTADSVANLIRYNPSLGLRVVEMPFLQTHQPMDTGAASSLAYISWYDRAAANAVADHPWLEGGITDDQTAAVALTHGEYISGGNPAKVLSTAAPQFHLLQAALPMAGEIWITIATERGTARAADTARKVQQDLSWLEQYLDQALPTGNVLLHYGATMPPAAKGANVQTAILQPAHHHTPAQYRWVRHELAHYWWNSNRGWLDEGMAQVLTSLLNSTGQPASLPATSPGCPGNTRISNLDKDVPERNVSSQCIHAVGERFIRTLYQEAGYGAFQEGTRGLVDMVNQPPYQDMGLDQVKTACAHTPAALKAALDRWE